MLRFTPKACSIYCNYVRLICELQQQGRVLAASLLGGHFGRNSGGSSGLATGGSSSGLLKTLVTEWSGVHAKAIDFDNNLSPADMAQHIVNELLFPGGRIEVGYPQGNRTVFKTVPCTPKDNNVLPKSFLLADWVVLVTGGARGITARKLPVKCVIPGMTLVVVGLLTRTVELSLRQRLNITEIGELRRVLLEQARSQGLSPTPMQIERQLKEIVTRSRNSSQPRTDSGKQALNLSICLLMSEMRRSLVP
jgi:hypothetical protein